MSTPANTSSNTPQTPAGHWLVKSEPSTFSWSDLCRDGKTLWDGVRNYQARNHLMGMQVGDPVLFYHSMQDKAVVGLCQVSQPAFPEPGDTTGRWQVVELVPIKALHTPVTLAQIKATPALAEIPLVKQGRLSVMPLSQPHFEIILGLSNTALAD
ncbi:MAG: EVE domain-containing protein [Candidatus Melainabacteria bacterium]|nr:EVE domain-containing protein [Candidatus Melainabacteria bacterium]